MRPAAAPFIIVALVAVVSPAAAGAPAGPVLTLDEAIRAARAQNPSLAAAKEKLAQAAAWQRKALALFLPTWTAAGTYTHWNKEVAFDTPDLTSFYFDPTRSPIMGFDRYQQFILQKQDSFGASTTLSVPLLNMASFPRYAQVGDQARAAEAGARSYENELLYGVVTAYYAALGSKKIVAISQEGVTVAKGHHDAAKARHAAGEAPKLSALRAEIEYEKAQADLRRADNAFAAARESLAVLIERDAQFDVSDAAEVPLPAGWDAQKGGADAAVGLVDGAMRVRPDIAAAEAQVDAAEKARQEVWYRFFPTLSLSGTLRYSDSMGFIGDDYQWFMMLTANMVLYDGGVRYADLREKASAIVESRHSLAAARGSAKGQVRQAAVELDTCGLNRASAVKQVDLARETYRVAKANFDLGVATSYEVTDANGALTSAQINLAREDLGCQLSRLKLLKALGTINDQYK